MKAHLLYLESLEYLFLYLKTFFSYNNIATSFIKFISQYYTMKKLTLKELKKKLRERGLKNITKEDIYYWGIIISIEKINLGNIDKR